MDEEDYPWWRFLVRLCAVIGGVYATVGMLYNHLSLLGCGFQKLRGTTPEKPNNYHKFSSPQVDITTPISSPVPHLSPLNPMLSAFETPEVQFVGQTLEHSSLCDIAADSATVTYLDGETSTLLPDLLSSHTSNQ